MTIGIIAFTVFAAAESDAETVILIILIPGGDGRSARRRPAARGNYTDSMPVKTGCTWNT